MISLRSARTSLAGGAIVALAGLALTACGSSGGTASSSPEPPKTNSGKTATVGVTSTSLGNTLVDAKGRTLYLFKKDTGTTSNCTGACAAAWPPLIASGTPSIGSGAKASLIGTTQRSDGKTQVTYNGHPLYLFSGDNSPGDTNGQGVTAFGAAWFAVAPSGSQVSGSSSSSSSGGSGFNY